MKKITNLSEYLNTYKEDLPLLEDPHVLLREISEEFREPFDFKLELLKNKMLKVMEEHSGIGLAAPQVGLNLRIILMSELVKIVDNKPVRELILIINPEIISKQGSCSIPEGCLSIPGKKVNVERAEEVNVRYQNEKGQIVLKKMYGINAICIQHEIDHLDGKLMTDYL